MISKAIEIRQRKPAANIMLDGLPELLQRLYVSRGIQHSDECKNDMGQLIHPSQLLHIDVAASLLYQAIEKHKRILVVGDFDADGATATVVAIRGLRLLGAEYVDYLVPDRFKYGYGLTPEIVEAAASKKPDLIITVDNGISSIEGVATAKQKGWHVLVTDHHLPGEVLPSADVIVNPNQYGDGFPSKSLSGVGVMFYVLAALRKRLEEENWFSDKGLKVPNLSQLLDLVALGTVADVVPLDQNNRILVEQGLRRIRAGHCAPGISALIRVSGRNQLTLSASDLGYAVAPRLNAAGRIEDMSAGIECLLTDDTSIANETAQQLDMLNRERRSIEDGMKETALNHVDQLIGELGREGLPYAVSLYDETWHQGVIGILASRLKEQIHRPVIAFAPDSGDAVKGSARSIPGLHIRDALDRVASQNPGLLTRFGGHAMAAGLSLQLADLDRFSLAFESAARSMMDEEALTSIVWTDGGLDTGDMNVETARMLQCSGPWGQGFPEPVFEGDFVVLSRRIVGEKHLKLLLRADVDATEIDAIHFFFDEQDWPVEHGRYHLVYKLAVNEYRGQESAQLIIEHAIALD
jgi:single-stranded-DNA-specific exonuclease